MKTGSPSDHAPRRFRVTLKRHPEYLTIPAVFVVFILLWEYVTQWLQFPEYVLPRPSSIAQTFGTQLTSETFWYNVGITAQEAGLGFVIGASVAFALGIVLSQFVVVDRTVMPYLVALQAIPLIALAPLFVSWFGFGLTSKVVMAAIISFFPMVVNVAEGLRSCSKDKIEMLRSFGATRRQIFVKAQLPNALPFIFVGLDVGIILAVLGAVVGEYVGAKAGLGYALLQFNFNFDIPGVFAMLIALAVMGIGSHTLVRLVQRRLVFWA
jgi:NitT/TauT family transport system permease protein